MARELCTHGQAVGDVFFSVQRDRGLTAPRNARMIWVYRCQDLPDRAPLGRGIHYIGSLKYRRKAEHVEALLSESFDDGRLELNSNVYVDAQRRSGAG